MSLDPRTTRSSSAAPFYLFRAAASRLLGDDEDDDYASDQPAQAFKGSAARTDREGSPRPAISRRRRPCYQTGRRRAPACEPAYRGSSPPRARRDKAMDKDRLRLSDPVRTIHRLALHRRIPPWVVEDNGVGLGQCETDATRLQTEQENRRSPFGKGVEHLAPVTSLPCKREARNFGATKNRPTHRPAEFSGYPPHTWRGAARGV
jgi:hypothetical protein